MRLEDEIKQTKFTSPLQKAHLNTLFTANWILGISKEIMKPFGITPQQYNVLRILNGKKGQACSADDIKAVMLDKNPDLTRMLDRLKDKGYIVRSVCEKNRRKLDILITQDGVKLLNGIGPHLRVRHESMNNITAKEADELSRILDKLRS